MSCKSIIFFIASLFILIFPCYSAARENIQWIMVNWPPFVITDGKFKGMGTFDEILQLLIKRMDDYDHQVIHANAKRLFSSIENTDNTCSIGWLKNEKREKIALFSIAHSVAPSLTLVTASEKEGIFTPLLDEKKSISLGDTIVNHHELKLGIIGERSYTTALDTILKEQATRKNTQVRIAGDLGNGLLKMLAADRIDYTIEYPHVVNYTVKEMSLPLSPCFIPISEIDTSELYGYTICSTGPVGEKAIAAINRIFREEMPELIKIGEKWFTSDTIETLQTNGAYKILLEQ